MAAGSRRLLVELRRAPQDLSQGAVRLRHSLYGSDDTVAPPGYTLPAMKQLGGPTYVVEFIGQPHVYTGAFWSDREEWELLFFEATLRENETARELLRTTASIAGFGNDRQRFDYQKAE